MDVFRQRLEDEYDANVIITAPTVPYKSIISFIVNPRPTLTIY
jgi:translation elongation factor EF-4